MLLFLRAWQAKVTKKDLDKVYLLMSACPMLGLLGTTLGLSRMFRGMEEAEIELSAEGSDQILFDLFAEGMSIALPTTVMGLIASLLILPFLLLIQKRSKDAV